MPSLFQEKATEAFHDVITNLDWPDYGPTWIAAIIAKASAAFAERMEAAFKAFEACTTGDKLEEHLLTQRAERAATELLRAYIARKDSSYAMERFWATFYPPQAPRLW